MRQTIAAAFIATCALISGGHTQDYPTRPVTMVVPFAAGGPTDVLARVVADRMAQLLGQQVVVENIGGAGGMTGAQRVAQALPDGYTIGLGTVGTMRKTKRSTSARSTMRRLISRLLAAQVPLVLISARDLPANNLREFIAYLKANQDKISYGSAGKLRHHLGCALLNAAIPASRSARAISGTGRYAGSCRRAHRLSVRDRDHGVAAPGWRQADRDAVVAAFASLRTSRPPTAGCRTEAYTWNAIFLPKGARKRSSSSTTSPWKHENPSVRRRKALARCRPGRQGDRYLDKFVAKSKNGPRRSRERRGVQ